jgi:hypothetical protein
MDPQVHLSGAIGALGSRRDLGISGCDRLPDLFARERARLAVVVPLWGCCANGCQSCQPKRGQLCVNGELAGNIESPTTVPITFGIEDLNWWLCCFPTES